MRAAFTRTLVELAEQDSQIVLLSGDLGFMALEPFSERFPDRFFNVGVAEQNMVGLATGLAEAGFIPFVYSIVTFATLRPYEFIRNGPILQHLPVRIVGIGGGFEYGTAGSTHHGLEDLGVMRVQPGITVVAPADYEQTHTAMLETAAVKGPIYYRLGKDDKTVIAGLNGRFRLGQADVVRDGQDLLLITTGSITSEVVEAAKLLEEEGINSTLMVVSSFNPSPLDDLADALGHFSLAVTVEAHYLNGGLGSMVAEVIAENGLACRLVRHAVKDTPRGISGSQAYLYALNQLDSLSIVQSVKRELQLIA